MKKSSLAPILNTATRMPIVGTFGKACFFGIFARQSDPKRISLREQCLRLRGWRVIFKEFMSPFAHPLGTSPHAAITIRPQKTNAD